MYAILKYKPYPKVYPCICINVIPIATMCVIGTNAAHKYSTQINTIQLIIPKPIY